MFDVALEVEGKTLVYRIEAGAGDVVTLVRRLAAAGPLFHSDICAPSRQAPGVRHSFSLGGESLKMTGACSWACGAEGGRAA